MEAVATGAAANVTSEAAKGIFVEAKRHIQYVIFYKKNVDKFEEKLRTLIAKRTSVQKEVDAATRNVQKIKADVEEWCNRVDEKIEEEKKKVEDLQDRAKNKCFIGLCPPIKSRYQLSRGAEKGVTTFQELISERGQLSTAVGYLDVPEDIEEDEPPKDFLAFESREKVFNDVMQAVRDTSISMLGVYGMGSVGKTTLLEEVVRQAKKDKLFEWVVMVPITQNPVILTIQDQIAELLGLKLEDKTVEVRAHRLRQRFKEEKKKKEEKQKKEQKFLLVLDDLWAELDLTKVGIPFGDEESPCKMMLSSRDQNVLLQFEGMYAHNSFQIGLLDYKETLHLFKKIIGESNQSSMSELQTEGNEIAERCGGLPVAISAVAKTLRNQPPSAWRDALKQLQSPSSGGLNDISPAVYTALKWSYNHIKGEKVKRFFLFCNMLSHNTLIEDLLKYSIGLGFFPGDYKVEEARDRMLTWVSNLKASGLLLNSYSDDRFDIHDVISNVAISIASTEDNQLLPLKQEDVLKDWPDEETMKHRSWINLRVANNTVLPDVVECPQLSFLQISGQETKMPPYFLKEMKKLQVLDLTVMDLSSFPSSIGLLSSLQTLCLDYSILGDITVVGELKTLEILSLRNSYIQRLPEEIGQLFRLRMLDLRGCTKKIPPGLLSKLTKLEELYIGESFDKWEAAADANQRGNASFSELSSLSRLTTLEVHIRDAQMVLGNFSFIQKLKRYKIFMGKEWLHDWYFYDYKCSRTLILRSTSINHLHHEIKMIMERTEYLHLEGLEDVDNATETDEEVSTFTSTTEQQCLLRFGEKMVNPCLTTLIIARCHNLKYLFSASTATSLVHLQHFVVVKCDSLRDIIISTEGNVEEVLFPNLEALELSNLSKLKRFCSGKNHFKLSSLKTLKIGSCYEFKTFVSDSIMGYENHHHIGEENKSEIDFLPLFNEKVALPVLKTLQISCLKDLKRIWDDQQAADSFCKLEDLEVYDCKKFLSIFPFNMSRRLQKLRRLEVSSCDSVEEIIEGGRESNNVVTTNIPQFEFPQLTYLELYKLPNLKSLYRKMHTTKWPSLEYIKVRECYDVEIFAAEYDEKLKDRNIGQGEETQLHIQPLFWTTKDHTIFPSLQKLELETNANLREILLGQFQPSSLFNNLTTLHVRECPKLESLVPSTVSFENLTDLQVISCDGLKTLITHPTAKSMTRLTRMGIFCCQMIREIVACERQDVKEVITFADLEILELGELPSLLCFCSGSVAFEFHSLKEVMVRECQYMMRFSQKKSSTPMLKGVKFTRRVNEVRSDDNLENTIKQMFMEEVGYSKHLKLSESSNFELIEIWRQNPRENFDFKSLKFLEICDCSTLTCLLTISMAMDLPQLQDLKVKDAKLMEHIMIDEGPDEEVLTISFPRLTSITLESCSNITSFYKGSKMLQCKSLTRITVKDCPQMFAFAYTISREQIIIEKIDGAGNLVSRVADAFVAPFFNDKVELPSLGVLQLSPFMKKTILPSDKLQRLWHDQTLGKSCYFLNLKILKLEGCNFLNYVFPLSMAENFVRLEQLIISDCDNVKEVMVMDKFVAEEGGIIIKAFPKLGTMELNSLPKLLRFCYGDSIVFPMLHDLRIENCPEFTTFVSNFVIGYEGQVDPNVDVLCLFNDKVAFPTLQKLEILRQFKWKKMWHDKLTPNSFAKLKHLKLEKCDGLSSIFPSSMVDRLQKLNLMEISRCDDLESIIEPFHSTESSPKFVFSRVRWLKLESLSKLKSFYPIMHTTQWPSLKKLIVNGCTNVKIFAQEINSQALHIPSEQPLFWFSKETFPCLKKLKTDQDGAKEILELTNYQGVKFVGEDEDDYYSYYYCT